jgi:hypothetical protein
MAAPLMAAMTGLSRSSMVRAMRCTPSQRNLFISQDWSFPSAMSRMSPPEQKVSPFPVTTMTRTAASSLAFSRYSRQSWIISALKAFLTSGRFKVRRTMFPEIS